MARQSVRVHAKRTDKRSWTMFMDLIIDDENNDLIVRQNYFGLGREDWDGSIEEWPFVLQAKPSVFDFGQGALSHPDGPYDLEDTNIFNVPIRVGERFTREHRNHMSHYEIIQVIPLC